MRCIFCRSTEKVEFEFPKGRVFGERCTDHYCMAGVIIFVEINTCLQQPFPDRRERGRMKKERENEN